ncbi:hypothetical protein ACFWNN_07930 [Lentzea sp. NPDC058450]|uniref:hypothetical protein n=1 Tax=Lentzea sp. NPDC058450 TaxID=3346505 RepID=UPI0036501ED1
MTASTGSSSKFGTALRGAIRDSGLTLQGVQARLARRGVIVGIATLSSWQQGRNRPEHADSLRAVRALEDMFDLPSGTLFALLGPRRPRGRLGGGARYDATPRWDAVSGMIGELRPVALEGVRVLFVEDQVELTADGGLREVRTRFMAEAEVDGLNRCCAVYFAVPGQDVDSVRTVPVRGCRLGRVHRDHENGLAGTELLLDRTYLRGEAFVIEYKAVVGEPANDDEYFRAITRPIGLYVAQVNFDRARLPVRCYRFQSSSGNRTEKEIGVIDGHTALLAEENAGSGECGIRWEWE